MQKNFKLLGRDDFRFPIDDYTPHGYLNNPKHSAMANPSGMIRSFPPVGMGFWQSCIAGYAADSLYGLNSYLSLLSPSLIVDGKLYAEAEDFTELSAPYHSSNILTYAFKCGGIESAISYFTKSDKALICSFEMANTNEKKIDLAVNLRHIYGLNQKEWWGSDAVTGRFVEQEGIYVSKILANGDVFVLMGTSKPSDCYVTKCETELKKWLSDSSQPSHAGPVAVALPKPLHGVLRYRFALNPGEAVSFSVALERGKSEDRAIEGAKETISRLENLLNEKLCADNSFYKKAPRLSGDFPDAWRRGFVYDFETLRVMVRDPVGIYKSKWDSMLHSNPRVVLAETAIDMAVLSYSDFETAKEVMLGVFKDAPSPQVPCTREDGSVNMIGDDGSECGTAPIWGMPIRVVRQLYERSGDAGWLADIYPYLKEFLLWWKKNRTDSEGWYHCNNSWESGQDGSRRFIVEMDITNDATHGANATFVRTADLEAAMASAFGDMLFFSEELGETSEKTLWETEYNNGLRRIEAMFVPEVNSFCDFDARSGKPIIHTDYFDLMLSMPAALEVCSDLHRHKAAWLFDAHYRSSRQGGYSLIWPPILWTVTKAAFNSDRQDWAAAIIARQANESYSMRDCKAILAQTSSRYKELELFAPYRYIIPGHAFENLAGKPFEAFSENYGWGALLPMLIFENILGLQSEGVGGYSFSLCIYLPDELSGKSFIIKNIHYGGFIFDLNIKRNDSGLLVKASFAQMPGKLACSEESAIVSSCDVSFQVEMGKKVVIAADNESY